MTRCYLRPAFLDATRPAAMFPPVRRGTRPLPSAGLVALCVMTGLLSSGAGGAPAAPAPGGVGQLAPLVFQGLRPPIPFRASDGKTHLTYVVTIQNGGPVPVRINRISVLDA